jgi:hypothetical protein
LPMSKNQIFFGCFDTKTHLGRRGWSPGPLSLFMTLICAEIFTIRAIKIKNDFEKIARTFQTSTLVQRPRSLQLPSLLLIKDTH